MSRKAGFWDLGFVLAPHLLRRVFSLGSFRSRHSLRAAIIPLLSVIAHAAVAAPVAQAQTSPGQPSSIQALSLDASSYFLEASEYSTGGPYAESVAVADVNGDGIPDLVVANACLLSGGTCPINYACTNNCVGAKFPCCWSTLMAYSRLL
jgi:FG-GAP repeat